MKIGHIADLHLGLTQKKLRRRKLDFFEAFKKAIDYFNENADLVVFAGDVFDSIHPDVETLLKAREIISKLKPPALIIPGNHDRRSKITGFSPIEIFQGMKNIYAIEAKIATIEIYGKKFLLVPHQMPRSDMDEITQKPADYIVYHGLVAGLGLNERWYKNIEAKDIPHAEQFTRYKYVFLGDIHRRIIRKINDTHIVYPSSIEVCTLTEVGKPHGVVLYDTDTDEITTYDIPGRNIVILDNPKLEELDNINKESMVYIITDNAGKYTDIVRRFMYHEFLTKNIAELQYEESESIVFDVDTAIEALTKKNVRKEILPLVKKILNFNFENLSYSEIENELENMVFEYIEGGENVH